MCKKLEVTPTTLYKHKSRLLSGLRAYYNGWNESENKTINRIKVASVPLQEKKISFKFHHALDLYEEGLKKESKPKLLILENELLSLRNNTKFKFLTLTHIYEMLMVLNTYKNNKKKVLQYFDKLKNVCNKTHKLNLSKEEKSLLSIRINYGGFLKDHNQFHRQHSPAKIVFYLKKVYKNANKLNLHDYSLRALHNMAITHDMLGNQPKAMEYCIEGYNLSTKIGNIPAKYSFASFLVNLQSKSDHKNYPIPIKEIFDYYHTLKAKRPLYFWTLYLEGFCTGICIHNQLDTGEFFNNTINSTLLSGDYSYAVYWRFNLEKESNHRQLISTFVFKDDWSYLDKVDNALLDSSENSCLTTLHYNKAINDMGFIWDVHMLRLVALFFREHDFDYESAMLTANKMDWLIKNKRKVSALSSFELLKLGIKMLEDADNPKHMLSRYEFRFKKLLDDFKASPQEISIMDYAIASSLARRLGQSAITALVKGLYQWLQTHHPAILAPVFRELEEKKSKVYTAEDKEAAA